MAVLDSPVPTDWESQILFPARLLVGFPAEARRKLQQAGAELYLMILEGLGEAPTSTVSPVAQELRSLVEELLDLAQTCRTLEGFEGVAASLEGLVGQVTERLGVTDQAGAAGQTAHPTLPLRPFLRDMVSDSRHFRAIADLGEGLAAVRQEPAPRQQLMALGMDLLWIKTVLEHHIAPRGEVAGLGPGDSALCVLAGRLAAHLQEPITTIQAAVETFQEEEQQEQEQGGRP